MLVATYLLFSWPLFSYSSILVDIQRVFQLTHICKGILPLVRLKKIHICASQQAGTVRQN